MTAQPTHPPCPSDKRLADALRCAVPLAQAAWVYGSLASGRMNAHSDIDLAVLLPVAMDMAQKRDWSAQLSDALARDIDLVDFGRVSCVLQKEILTHGRQLYATDPVRVRLHELHALAQYRAYNERYAADFERIARTGKVYP